MSFAIGFCIVFGILAFFVFVSTKIIILGGLKYLYFKAGVLGAVYGLLFAFLYGYLGSIGLAVARFEYLLNAPEIVKTHMAQLSGEATRLAIELSLLQNGPDFAIKGSMLVIGITYALKHSGIPWFKALSPQPENADAKIV